MSPHRVRITARAETKMDPDWVLERTCLNATACQVIQERCVKQVICFWLLIHGLVPEILCIVLQTLKNVNQVRVKTVVPVQTQWLSTFATVSKATMGQIARMVSILINAA